MNVLEETPAVFAEHSWQTVESPEQHREPLRLSNLMSEPADSEYRDEKASLCNHLEGGCGSGLRKSKTESYPRTEVTIFSKRHGFVCENVDFEFDSWSSFGLRFAFSSELALEIMIWSSRKTGRWRNSSSFPTGNGQTWRVVME